MMRLSPGHGTAWDSSRTRSTAACNVLADTVSKPSSVNQAGAEKHAPRHSLGQSVSRRLAHQNTTHAIPYYLAHSLDCQPSTAPHGHRFLPPLQVFSSLQVVQ